MVCKVTRTRIIIACIILSLGLSLGFLSKRTQEAFDSSNLIRLHILANSNSPADQDLKLIVRNKILAAANSLFSGVLEKEQAIRLINDNWDFIRNTAREVIEQSGYDYDVKLELGDFTFPDRSYAGLTLPAGNYQALRVVIGEGKGDNWWCVLFPPLCFADLEEEPEEDAVVKLAIHLEEGDIEIRWKFWERLGETEYGQSLQEWWRASLNIAKSYALPMLVTEEESNQ